MTSVRLEVSGEEREVLLDELSGFLETTAALYRQIGGQWDPEDSANAPPEVALVVRARDQLTADGPWQIEGTADELELLLGRLRAAAELALERGAQRSPTDRSIAMNASDVGGTDTQLDILRVSERLLGRVRAPEG